MCHLFVLDAPAAVEHVQGSPAMADASTTTSDTCAKTIFKVGTSTCGEHV